MAYEPLMPFLFEWVRRKVRARVQRRVGPPLLQPVYDFLKLLGKEFMVPGGAATAAGAALLFLTNVLALFAALNPFPDVVLLLLFLFLLDVALKVFLAHASGSPFTMQGMSRLAGLKMALDPAFPLSILAPAFLYGFSMDWPARAAVFFPLAFIASMAELELPPFDIPTAEAEIAGGWKAELSGALLGMVSYAEYAKAVAVSALLASFLGTGWLALKAVLVFTAMSMVSAASPRFSMHKVVRLLTLLNILALSEVVISLALA